jgi:hypothetical protein
VPGRTSSAPHLASRSPTCSDATLRGDHIKPTRGTGQRAGARLPRALGALVVDAGSRRAYYRPRGFDRVRQLVPRRPTCEEASGRVTRMMSRVTARARITSHDRSNSRHRPIDFGPAGGRGGCCQPHRSIVSGTCVFGGRPRRQPSGTASECGRSISAITWAPRSRMTAAASSVSSTTITAAIEP